MRTTHTLLAFAATAAAVTALVTLTGCAATSHPTTPAALGVPRTSGSLEQVVDEPGPIELETHVTAEWVVPRSGLVNLDHPAAKAAGLKDGDEPIELYVHLVRHPTRGLFLVDTGVEHQFVSDREHALVGGVFGSLAHVDRLKVHEDTAAILAHAGQPLQGVFLTHLHLDHVMGMRDVPCGTPVFVGPGDARDRTFMNLFERGIYDDALAAKGPLREIRFQPDPDGAFEGLLDVFGDGSFWAIWVPGHTPGLVAYVARTTHGPVLVAGDASHTAWGWVHGVEPGSFSDDVAKSADSLARLERFVVRHPRIEVKLGHQRLAAPAR